MSRERNKSSFCTNSCKQTTSGLHQIFSVAENLKMSKKNYPLSRKTEDSRGTNTYWEISGGCGEENSKKTHSFFLLSLGSTWQGWMMLRRVIVQLTAQDGNERVAWHACVSVPAAQRQAEMTDHRSLYLEGFFVQSSVNTVRLHWSYYFRLEKRSYKARLLFILLTVKCVVQYSVTAVLLFNKLIFKIKYKKPYQFYQTCKAHDTCKTTNIFLLV